MQVLLDFAFTGVRQGFAIDLIGLKIIISIGSFIIF